MKLYRQGEYIRLIRKQIGMSQDILAGNIMNRSTLSKVENGLQAISQHKFKLLMTRMGKSLHNVPLFLLDGKNEEIHLVMDELDTVLSRRQYVQAEELIKKLEDLLQDSDDAIQQQYLLLVKVALLSQKQQLTPETLNLLEKALNLGITGFKETDIKTYYLTGQDIKAINLLALYYQKNGATKKAIKILEQLENNLSKNLIDKVEKGQHYPLVAYNLGKYYRDVGNFHKSLVISECGLACCKESNSFFFSPLLTMNKIHCLFEQGDFADCQKLIKEVYYTFSNFGLERECQMVTKYAEEKLDLILEKKQDYRP